MRERLRRATAYPYEVPTLSFVQLGPETTELTDLPDLSGRCPLLAYGSNAAPEALTRKLAVDPDTPLPLIRAELDEFDVVYSSHLSPYGAVPATLLESPGTTVTVFVAYPTEQQRRLLSATEPNYEPQSLAGISCRFDDGTELDRLDAFRSRHGPLRLDGMPVALSAIPASGRALPDLSEPDVLERVRSKHFPGLSLEQMIGATDGTSGLPLSFR
jgi:hypothetical protein